MKKYHLLHFVVICAAFLSPFIGGCASQPKKSKVPTPLESEMRSIEGQKSGASYQPSISGEKTTYVVKKGDTLWRISKNYGVSVDTILRANHIGNTKDLKVGQKLIIPTAGKSYTSFASHSSCASTTSNVTGGVSARGFIWPVKGQIVSQFGETRNGVKNSGIYILPQPGQKVVAAKKGTVEAVTDADDGMRAIVIKHEGGVRTIYGCCCNPVVGEGSYVEQGQPIANANPGGTGKSQEVNFKIYVKDKPVNPMSYLP
ncbi:MAG: LysM peptidoglycan-binding domain-containing protein [Candidatus Brocadia sp. AMX2]|nr:MAG: LysM peptidoglycan-binding domain-containing protein [Candidatus Brocadia sp. AMX2]MBC6932154.1 LysM peptidoglycan-binding domain-containing protein [Candidatus Brocadia sp.]MBL1169423.1 LysM peptidoglycan-binding domain-containing protein [Candidatus Brocadia sp. AMX1]MCE7866413.1 LysM peptidoglycan-binding domain-containing protein [Candidatus Brocadia sp. AMX2]MCQ3917199.1 LysM peptidoglycan-binding domain-containing protein [Candidatus Brocadia sp.]